jgi:predicted ATPase
MNRKGESLYLPDDIQIQAARKEGYRKGWNDRRIFDEGIVQDALRDSRNYMEFAENVRQKLSEAGEKTE